MHDIALGLVYLCFVAGVVLLFRDVRVFLTSRSSSFFGALLFGLPLGVVYVFSQADDLSHINIYSNTIDYWDSAIIFLPLTCAAAFCGYWLGGKPARDSWFLYLGKAAACGIALAIVEVLIISIRHGFALFFFWVAAGSIVLVSYNLFFAAILRVFADRIEAKRVASSSKFPSTIHENDSRHFVLTFASCLIVPLLLSAPIVLMLRYDADAHKRANSILLQQIGTIDAQMGDLKDLDKVHSQLLARKQVDEALEASAAQAAGALQIFGNLPRGVKLLLLQTQQNHLSLTVQCGAFADELATLGLLAQNGYRNLRISARESQEHGTIERVTIEGAAR
jgi:hypothetical protein